MGRELQKKKNRSSIPKKRLKPKSKKQILNNPIIAANWSSSQTPSQNYRRLGLVRHLNKATGGKEKTVAILEENDSGGESDDPLAINAVKQVEKTSLAEAIIERDPDTGAVIRVVEQAKPNPLNDPLNDLDEVEHIGFTSLGRIPKRDKKSDKDTNVTRQLEEWAANGVRTAPRRQSKREEEWIENLVKKHGEDYKAMFWDSKLNIFQQSEGEIKRRVKKWKQTHG